ncbi:hypothetical protein VNO77_34279 [Canavalia gladiata]|uniref:Uncharacterized protein n=1 Tax=Canavalia gladiata TaxID=3824 RepID=A0AAN9PYE5_CANGL
MRLFLDLLNHLLFMPDFLAKLTSGGCFFFWHLYDHEMGDHYLNYFSGNMKSKRETTFEEDAELAPASTAMTDLELKCCYIRVGSRISDIDFQYHAIGLPRHFNQLNLPFRGFKPENGGNRQELRTEFENLLHDHEIFLESRENSSPVCFSKLLSSLTSPD